MSHNALRLFPSPNPRSDWFGKTRTGRYSLRVQARGTIPGNGVCFVWPSRYQHKYPGRCFCTRRGSFCWLTALLLDGGISPGTSASACKHKFFCHAGICLNPCSRALLAWDEHRSVPGPTLILARENMVWCRKI